MNECINECVVAAPHGQYMSHLDGSRLPLVRTPEEAPLSGLHNQLPQLEVLDRWTRLISLNRRCLHHT